MQNLVVVLVVAVRETSYMHAHSMLCACMYEVPNVFGTVGHRLLGRGNGKTKTPHVCYYTEFSRSGSNRLGVGLEIPKIGDAWARPLGWGMADPRNMLHPACVTVPNLVILAQTVRA